MMKIITAFIILGALAVLGYFYVYPLLQPKPVENLTNTTNVTCTKLIQYSGVLAPNGSFECPLKWEEVHVTYCLFVDVTDKITRIDAGVVRAGLPAGSYVVEYYRCT
jgi:hypothetical protein